MLKRIPFLQILFPFTAGILTAWYGEIPVYLSLAGIITGSLLLSLFYFLPVTLRFRFTAIPPLAAFLLLFSIGAIRCVQEDIRNQGNWLGHQPMDSTTILAVLEEPPVEKPRSVKVLASVKAVLVNGTLRPVKGKAILYFKKDSSNIALQYGTTLVFKKPLQEIKNAGNPGGFDYKRYALFQGITHQLYLQQEEYRLLPGLCQGILRKHIINSGNSLVSLLQRYIPGEKEAGLAEALLIGYKNDLDPALVQAYSNTGVVHIIAISGLHLGLIYGLLLLLLKPIRNIHSLRWLHPLLVIAGLWAFSLLAGAQPSVLRSALMFSCIAAGEFINRKTYVINSLLASAFLLLCYNPFWLWDLGFQLSYSAVLSILLFMKPVYNWFYIKNKLLDYAWKMNAVSIAAQVLTLPVSVYHFHQFPVSFLFTNFIAVPLSSAILLVEILLCSTSFIPAFAQLQGQLIAWGIRLMNNYVETVERIPYASWKGLQLSTSQAVCLTLLMVSASYFLLEKSRKALYLSGILLLLFCGERMVSFKQALQQQKIIVYNVSQKKAIDFISGRTYFFSGDSDLMQNAFARNFHLQPARTLYRANQQLQPGQLLHFENYYSFLGRHILWLNQGLHYPLQPGQERPVIDLLILSGNPRLYLNRLTVSLDIRQVVIDAAASPAKARYWKKDCDSLHIPCHDVREKGAFEMRLN